MQARSHPANSSKRSRVPIFHWLARDSQAASGASTYLIRAFGTRRPGPEASVRGKNGGAEAQ
jgi:hypothetical protein